MDWSGFDDPLVRVWGIAAALMAIKVMGQGWMTVYRMMKVNAGFASPEDLRAGPLNKAPDPAQLAANDYVERSRRMHRNDLENIPAFWVAGFLFILAEPPLWLAQVALYGFVLARAGHAVAYATARSHEVRATFYTIGSVLVIAMAVYALVALVAV